MFKNYLKLALRSIQKHKGFSFINIAGLTVGLACSICIAVYVRHELSFDKHHENAHRIYRVCPQFGPGGETSIAWTSPPMAQAMLEDFPEVEKAIRFDPWPSNDLVRYGEKSFLEKRIKYADDGIFDVFTIPFLLGDPETALIDPHTIVITQGVALKYFGTENPLGKSLRFVDRKKDFKVTGVVENCPDASHLQYDMIASLASTRLSLSNRWMSHCYFTYVCLSEGIKPSQLEEKFPDFVLRHYGPQFLADTGVRFEEHIKDKENYFVYILQPLPDIHLNTQINDNLSIKGNPVAIYAFFIIAVFILLIACINFMNLSTARFTQRSKEVGLRKVLGSSRKQLIWQFLGESVFMSLVALAFSLVIVQIVMPVFGRLADRQLALNYVQDVYLLPALICVALFVGILAGSYPAFFLSSFQPARAIKGAIHKRGKGHLNLRRALVILQFGITFAVFFGTLVISHQLRFFRQKNLGFDKDQIVVIHRANDLGSQAESFKQELLRHPQIKTISHTETLPGRHYNPNSHHLEGRPSTETPVLWTMYADSDYVELLGLETATGRYFSREIPTDMTSAVVINETAVKELGLNDPIGKRFDKEFGGAKKGEYVTIIGVVKDYHFLSLHHDILPMLIRPLSADVWRYTSIKVGPERIPETLALIESAWRKFAGGQPFEYSFLDDDFDSLYKSEKRAGQLFSLFSFLAIFVACLGLFGLVSFAAEQRTKEIGIRKVLGASVSRIILLLSREVILLVFVASLIAAPLGFLAMRKWLENFAYRIDLSPSLFMVTAMITLSIAVLSVSYRAIKAACANPADAIRNE
ncbi:ABC transporter permease [Acidobacteriota bacterium]